MLPKSKRLSKKKDFAKLGVHGRSSYGPHMTMRVCKVRFDEPRVAFITSTKVMKKAVDRNRAKRRMREIIRRLWEDIPKNVYLVFVLQATVKDIPNDDLVTEVRHLLEKVPLTLLKPARLSPRARKNRAKRAIRV